MWSGQSMATSPRDSRWKTAANPVQKDAMGMLNKLWEGAMPPSELDSLRKIARSQPELGGFLREYEDFLQKARGAITRARTSLK